MFAGFALDEHGFFSSPDIQLLRIGTIVRSGLLLPPHLDVYNTPEYQYNVFSVSIDLKEGFHLIQDFYNKVKTSPSKSGANNSLVFEVKLVRPDYWQVKVRFLMNNEDAAALHYGSVIENC